METEAGSSTEIREREEKKAAFRWAGRAFANTLEFTVDLWQTKLGRFAVGRILILGGMSFAAYTGGSLLTTLGLGHEKSHKMDTVLTVMKGIKTVADSGLVVGNYTKKLVDSNTKDIKILTMTVLKMRGGRAAYDASKLESDDEYQQWLRLQRKYGRPLPSANARRDTVQKLLTFTPAVTP